ncbi:MAG: hypothetical protein V2A66_01320 [Pseudomonadota bacterium]
MKKILIGLAVFCIAVAFAGTSYAYKNEHKAKPAVEKKAPESKPEAKQKHHKHHKHHKHQKKAK